MSIAYNLPANRAMIGNLPSFLIECANALGLSRWTVKSRLARSWSPLEACATPPRFRSPRGRRQSRVRHGRPRCMSEAYATIGRAKLRREDVIEAREWLVTEGLLPPEIAATLPLARKRRIPWQEPKPRVRRAKPIMFPRKLATKEHHREP
jgi:hypothetical protein